MNKPCPMSHAEIGQRLGLSRGMVRYHERRALDKMREAFAEDVQLMELLHRQRTPYRRGHNRMGDGR